MERERIIVLGAGESGVGAALLAAASGLDVFVSDEREIGPVFREELLRAGIPFEEGGHFSPILQDATTVVKSPGIPGDHIVVEGYRRRGIEVISEIEFASRFVKGRIVAITGTNGKTTTTHLVHHLFRTAGYKVACGGNIGRAFSRLALDEPQDWYILEVSSFQLDDVVRFHPSIGIILNVTPDHLDRYGNAMSAYTRAKMNLALNQGPEDVLLIQAGNRYIEEALSEMPLRVSVQRVGSPDGRSGQWLRVEDHTYDLTGFVLQGEHNLFNTTCAIRAARLAGIDTRQIQEGLKTFLPVSHRLEPVGTVEGVQFINDSKATNVDAVWYALKAMEKPVIWIAGGKDKGNDYQDLMDLVREKVRALVCLGLDVRKLESSFAGIVPEVIVSRNMDDAVCQAYRLAHPGDCVLLSPACASFDLFRNYEHRGDMFREAIGKLKNEETP